MPDSQSKKQRWYRGHSPFIEESIEGFLLYRKELVPLKSERLSHKAKTLREVAQLAVWKIVASQHHRPHNKKKEAPYEQRTCKDL